MKDPGAAGTARGMAELCREHDVPDLTLPTLADPTYAATIARLARRTSVEGDWNGTPHWLYTGTPIKSGYAQVMHLGKLLLIHRLGQMAIVGPIPDGYQVDHCCRVKLCWNPAHTEPVTGSTNQRRATPYRAKPDPKVVCPHGHDLTLPDAVRVRLRGDGQEYRCCAVCERSRGGTAHRDDVAVKRGPKPPKPFCPRGHAMIPGNVYEHTNSKGYIARECRTCKRERGRPEA